MTEAEWLACEEPEDMLLEVAFPPLEVSERKLRLNACACCRLIWPKMSDPRSREAVEVAERFACGLASAAELHEAKWAAQAVFRGTPRPDLSAPQAEYYAECSADSVTRLEDGWQFWEHARDVIERAVKIGREQNDGPGEAEIRCQAVSLLREIVGNPFRPVAFSPSWRTGTALSLAQQMYDSRDFGAMPILADALQDAGCGNEDILNHCRDANPRHTRGCWVVDLVLGNV